MAKPKIVRGTYLNILLGNSASPTEVFSPVCGARTKALTHAVETFEDYTRDCAVPDDIPSRNVGASGERWDLSFSGVLNRTQLADLRAVVGIVKNYRFELGQPAGDVVVGAGGYYAGAGMLTSFTITGDDGANATIEGTILSDGDWAWTTV